MASPDDALAPHLGRSRQAMSESGAKSASSEPPSGLRPEWVIDRQGKRFVLVAGLLALAHELGLHAIQTNVVQLPNDTNGQTAVIQAKVVLPGPDGLLKEFGGIGDANPGNVSRQIAPHLIRMAETRAIARALRLATNIGLVALEELGPDADEPPAPRTPATNGHTAPASRPGQGTPAPAPAPATGDVRAQALQHWDRLVAEAKRVGEDVRPRSEIEALEVDGIREAYRELRERVEARKRVPAPNAPVSHLGGSRAGHAESGAAPASLPAKSPKGAEF